MGSGAVVAVEADESATEASSSLSVSTKSSGFLMVGAASRNSKGSWLDPLLKNKVSRFHNSLQSVPAIVMNKCWRASCLRAMAFPSSSAERRKSRRAYKI